MEESVLAAKAKAESIILISKSSKKKAVRARQEESEHAIDANVVSIFRTVGSVQKSDGN
ncbi:MAG TPA: hypothetical protein VFF30_13715 [Nitrososphaerales archaeon]|nr:hypothetical protein [Nitrososphaerales archaeon]